MDSIAAKWMSSAKPIGLRLSAGYGSGRFTNFNRYYFPQNSENEGGHRRTLQWRRLDRDYIVDWLNRPLLMAAMTREGKDNYSQM